MSIGLDRDYVNRISSRFRNFRWKSSDVAVFSCPLCGDSQRDKTRARGYVYRKSDGLVFTCHNCGASHSFAFFLQLIDPLLHKNYLMDRFRDGNVSSRKKEPAIKTRVPVGAKTKVKLEVPDFLAPLASFPIDHPVQRYVSMRQIPTTKQTRLYAVERTGTLANINDKYEKLSTLGGARLVFPFWNDVGQFIGCSARDVTGKAKQRYMIFRVDTECPLVFNYHYVDAGNRVYVTEGAIDSLFLPNAVAVNGSDMKKVLGYWPDMVFIFDNERRNPEIMAKFEEVIDAGAQLFVWPKSVGSKDINQWVLDGGKDIVPTIERNVFQGLRAKMAFADWRIA